MNAFKLLFKIHDIKQGELAEALEVSASTVSHWVTGKVTMSEEMQSRMVEYFKGRISPLQEQQAFALSQPTPKATKATKKPALTLEGQIKECKNYALDKYGFEIKVVKMK